MGTNGVFMITEGGLLLLWLLLWLLCIAMSNIIIDAGLDDDVEVLEKPCMVDGRWFRGAEDKEDEVLSRFPASDTCCCCCGFCWTESVCVA